MMAPTLPPEVDEDLEEAIDDGLRGALTTEERIECERFANECFAELRAGKPWREAWSLANRPDPSDFGAQDLPVLVKGKTWRDDALTAIFTGGRAPSTRAPVILADGALLVSSRSEGAKAPRGPVVSGGNPAGPATPAPRPLRAVAMAREGLPPRVPSLSAATPQPPPSRSDPMGQQDILDALAKGPLSRGAILAAIDVKGTVLDSCLYALKRKGDVMQDGRGAPWRLASSSSSASTPKTLEDLAARRTNGTSPRAARTAPRRAADKPARKGKTPPNGMPWGITDAIEIPAAPCKTREHGELVDAMLTKRADLVTKFVGKVAAIDAAIRSFIET